MQRYKDLSFFQKLLCVSIMAVVFFATGLFGFALPQFKKALYDQKRMTTQHLSIQLFPSQTIMPQKAREGRISLPGCQEGSA